MSMNLDLGTIPAGLCTKVTEDKIVIGDYEISYKDFCHLILYFMTNTDLTNGDPRLWLMTKFAEFNIQSGYNPGRMKFGFEEIKEDIQ